MNKLKSSVIPIFKLSNNYFYDICISYERRIYEFIKNG
ncbi:hypothetical protein ENHAE0001_0215 [Enhydrobacter aerosaccus SK60]|nr:hypothetical protein ENHAE0001_0215 [Enhydrobacter aerosaccus SK60]